MEEPKQQPDVAGGGKEKKVVVETHWCVLCREDGSMEVCARSITAAS